MLGRAQLKPSWSTQMVKEQSPQWSAPLLLLEQRSRAHSTGLFRGYRPPNSSHRCRHQKRSVRNALISGGVECSDSGANPGGIDYRNCFCLRRLEHVTDALHDPQPPGQAVPIRHRMGCHWRTSQPLGAIRFCQFWHIGFASSGICPKACRTGSYVVPIADHRDNMHRLNGLRMRGRRVRAGMERATGIEPV